MKTLLRFTLVVLLLSFLSPSAKADEPAIFTEADNVTILTAPTIKRKPRAPSMIYVTCYYSVGHIAFTMPDDAQYMHITLEQDDSTVWTGVVFKNSPETDIPELIGEYTITCRTDGNQVFTGLLTF